MLFHERSFLRLSLRFTCPLLLALSGAACMQFDNPVDPAANNYEGFSSTRNTPAPPPYRYFLYVANNNGGNLWPYAIGAKTGQLFALTPTSGTLNKPFAVVVAPTSSFLYVAENGTGGAGQEVSGYTIDPVSGALSPMAGSPFASGSAPFDLVVDPTGKFLYESDFAGAAISAYTIDQGSGALSPLPTATGNPFPTGGSGAEDLALDPLGRFLFVANNSSNTVSAYTIDGSSGALTTVTGSPFPAGTGPESLAVDPKAPFLFEADNGGTLTSYLFNDSSGALSQVGTVSAGSGPTSVAVDPSGRFVYSVDGSAGVIYSFSVDLNSGALSPIGSALPTGSDPNFVTVDPTDEYVYVANAAAGGSGTISAYSIGSTGALTALDNSPFASGTQPYSIAFATLPGQ